MHKFFLFFIISIFQAAWVFGQSDQVYEGEYEFKGREGIATFEFKEDNDDNLILDGFFRFDLIEIDSLDQTLITKFKVNGEYNENKKNGNWNFDKERHKINLEDVIDFEVQASLESEDIEVKAMYKDGIREGIWMFNENNFTRGKLEPKATANSIKFSDGYIVENIYFRRFEGEFTQYIRGEINENGYMDGEWSLVYVKDSVLISEVRNYENGFLLGVRRRNLETNDRIDEAIYYATIEKLKLMEVGENSGFTLADRKFGLPSNDGYGPNSPEVGIQEDGNEFIDEFIGKLLQFDDAVNEDGEIVEYPFHTSRFLFEFNKASEESLENIPEIYEKLSGIVEEFSEMNSLDLNKGKSDSLSFAYYYFAHSQKKLEEMEYFLGLIESGEIKYFDLSNFTKEGVDFMSPSELITYEYQGDTLRKLIPRIINEEGKDSFIESFELYLSEELSMVTELGNFVGEELYEIEVNSKLIALEAEILKNKNLVDSLYINYKSKSDDEQELFLAIYENFLETGFDEFSIAYANETEFTGKTEKGNLILNLLEELESRLPELKAIFPRVQELDKLYMEETFNPFTYTRYDVRAKERLFESGFIQLFNHYINELKEEEDYTEIKDHLNRIKKLQDRMIELRKVNTSGLERRLRRNNDPERIESILEL